MLEGGRNADHRFAVAADGRDVLHREAGIERHGPGADGLDGKIRHAPLRTVLGQDEHSIARAHVLAQEKQAQSADVVGGLPPADRLVGAAAFDSKERARAVDRGLPKKQRRDGVNN